MSFVAPQESALNVNDNGVDTVVTIKPEKNWFMILFMGFWLIGWAIGELMALGFLFGSLVVESSDSEVFAFGKVFMFAWLGGWTVGGFFAIKTFLWQLLGKEIVILNDEGISINKYYGVYTNKKSYGRTYIKDLRINQSDNSPFKNFNLGNKVEGKIAFDYGSKTFRFGVMGDEAEAKNLINLIRSKYPGYFKST